MKKFIVGCSPITSTLFAGTVTNQKWEANKKDVTDTAPLAVAQHLLQLNQRIKFDYQGDTYEMKVEKVQPSKKEGDEKV